VEASSEEVRLEKIEGRGSKRGSREETG